jgi:1,4-dihydroxy-6-naphthoate synthase
VTNALLEASFDRMSERILTLGHSPDPDDAFMFYGMAKGLIELPGFRFEHVLQDIQTLNERARREELDITAISVHAYAHVCGHYAMLPSGASMGDGYGPLVVGRRRATPAELRRSRIAVPGTMTSAFLALQLWLEASAEELDVLVVPFDQIFEAITDGKADAGLIIHEGQLTYEQHQLQVCQDLGVWWGEQNSGLPLPLGANVIHKRIAPPDRSAIAALLHRSIQYSLDHRAEAVAHALQYARDMGLELADRFVGMYVNHWTLDYGPAGREAIRRFLKAAFQRRLIPCLPELEFVQEQV